MKKVSNSLFSKMKNKSVSNKSMTTIVGGGKPIPEGETVPHSEYPRGDSGQITSGGIEKDDKPNS
ncbi:MAG: hypothetical protein ACI8ZM_004730 [Crocinitomix sp.]|jgi:hypothetical protein